MKFFLIGLIVNSWEILLGLEILYCGNDALDERTVVPLRPPVFVNNDDVFGQFSLLTNSFCIRYFYCLLRLTFNKLIHIQ